MGRTAKQIIEQHHAYLRGKSDGVKLCWANLLSDERENLRGSDLRGSDLRDSNLRDSDLSGSNLRYSNLSDSNLSGSNLRGSNLSYSNLRGSDLRGSDLSDSNLSGSNLRDSNLRGSDLRGSNLRGSDLDPFDIMQWNGGQFAVTSNGNYISIGCQTRTLRQWMLVSEDEAVGMGLRRELYPQYKAYIEMIAKLKGVS